MSKAGDNEKNFIKEFEQMYGKGTLEGKKPFGSRKKIYTSVDNSISNLKKDKKVFFEIDSYNMAKVMLGQYLLLNKLIKDKKWKNTEYMFVVITYNKRFNSERAKKYLNFTKGYLERDSSQNNVLKYRAFTIDEFKNFYKGGDIDGLIHKLFKLTKQNII